MNCKFCGLETKNEKFCSSSCAARFNLPKRTGMKYKKREKSHKKEVVSICRAIIAWMFFSAPASDKTIRSFLIECHDGCCQSCSFFGLNPKTNKSILQLHHKNGIHEDSSIDNLEILCPNCHAMTDGYGNSGGEKFHTEKYGFGF